jgi:hypothetical protein
MCSGARQDHPADAFWLDAGVPSMFKRVNFAAAISLAAYLVPGLAHNQARPTTTGLPCASVAGLVASRGAVVLSTGPNTYDRYVASGAACQRGEGTEAAFERTSDAVQCFIGYRCTRASAGGRGN